MNSWDHQSSYQTTVVFSTFHLFGLVVLISTMILTVFAVHGSLSPLPAPIFFDPCQLLRRSSSVELARKCCHPCVSRHWFARSSVLVAYPSTVAKFPVEWSDGNSFCDSEECSNDVLTISLGNLIIRFRVCKHVIRQVHRHWGTGALEPLHEPAITGFNVVWPQ